uniref:Uncharacterized protein n=1 Tax=Meloidogyne enterolobii TaxID=390850 RepID=A0A6V7XQ11_MELEN|nr:unnamed protein product [Meloidogyne enterolobii]
MMGYIRTLFLLYLASPVVPVPAKFAVPVCSEFRICLESRKKSKIF